MNSRGVKVHSVGVEIPTECTLASIVYIVQWVLKFYTYVKYNFNAESVFYFTSFERLSGDGLDCTCLSAEVSYLVGELL